jgi:pSer/pThr/pTyr-binding forkhead associated (FHA) protein
MRLILEMVSGPMKGKKVAVEEHQVVRVGRTTKADFVTEDTFMSGEHFAIQCEGEGCRLLDLKSRNGTKLNGELVTSAELHEGDRVYAGHTEFVVRFEKVAPRVPPQPQHSLQATIPPGKPLREILEDDPTATPFSSAPRQPPASPAVGTDTESSAGEQVKRPTPVRRTRPEEIPQAAVEKSSGLSPTPQPPAKPVSAPVKPVPPPTISPPGPMDSYEAATPEGRLLRLLRSQTEPLLALLDATHERKLLELLPNSGEEFQSLYKDARNDAIAPYLILLPPQSPLLKQMVRDGWGRSWGVYLTCRLPLVQLRDYFRRALMVSLPDGVELFSRFYDPRFFRAFLDTCSAAEADKFFGPISSYLMEAERPEILLQFTWTSHGVEKKGHLLSTLE